MQRVTDGQFAQEGRRALGLAFPLQAREGQESLRARRVVRLGHADEQSAGDGGMAFLELLREGVSGEKLVVTI